MARRSGLQGDILALYRKAMREAKKKDDGLASLRFAQARFRSDAEVVKRSDFKKIEFLLRQGHKASVAKLPLSICIGTLYVAIPLPRRTCVSP